MSAVNILLAIRVLLKDPCAIGMCDGGQVQIVEILNVLPEPPVYNGVKVV